MYTTTSIIVIITVVFNGTLTAPVLKWLQIRTHVNEEIETVSPSDKYRIMPSNNRERRSSDEVALLNSHNQNDEDEATITIDVRQDKSSRKKSGRSSGSDKTWLLKKWSHFDRIFMKPLLTNSYPPLTATLPACLLPITKLLTTKEQRIINRNERLSMENSDESILNNHHTVPTSNLIDPEGFSTIQFDYYPQSNSRQDESRSVNLRTDNNGDVSAHFTSPPSQPI